MKAKNTIRIELDPARARRVKTRFIILAAKSLVCKSVKCPDCVEMDTYILGIVRQSLQTSSDAMREEIDDVSSRMWWRDR